MLSTILALFMSAYPSWIITYQSKTLTGSYWSRVEMVDASNLVIWVKYEKAFTRDTTVEKKRIAVNCPSRMYNGEYAEPESVYYSLIESACTIWAR